jgi:hypothetical protein
MKDGTSREMVVTRVAGKKINGVLFFDGQNDQTNFPPNFQVNVGFHTVAHVKDVVEDNSEKPKPGTFHEIKYDIK